MTKKDKKKLWKCIICDDTYSSKVKLAEHLGGHITDADSTVMIAEGQIEELGLNPHDFY